MSEYDFSAACEALEKTRVFFQRAPRDTEQEGKQGPTPKRDDRRACTKIRMPSRSVQNASVAAERWWDRSRCGRYRYALLRIWDNSLPLLSWGGLNPSKASDRPPPDGDDPTIRKDMELGRRWGFGGIVKWNLFAFIATDPDDLIAARAPVGQRNDGAIRRWVTDPRVGRVVVSWGNAGRHHDRAETVLAMLRTAGVELWCLGVNKDGSPEHELYVPYARELRRYALGAVDSRSGWPPPTASR